MFEPDIKLVFAIVGAVLSTIAAIPYIRDTLRGRTAPHMYTWLIWVITGAVAGAGAWHGNGGWGIIGHIVGTFFIIVIFLLSLKYGTRNIKRSDTVSLVVALLAIVVWVQLENPILSIFMISAIDAVGYFPTYRKLWEEPRSETLFTWILYCATVSLSFFSLYEYNFLTSLYPAVILTCNIVVVALCILRRHKD